MPDTLLEGSIVAIRGWELFCVALWLTGLALVIRYGRTRFLAGVFTGETLYVFLPAVPYSLSGAEWGQEKDKHLARCLAVLEDYAPGIGRSVIGAHATSPVDLEAESGLHKGHLFHVDMTLGQFGPWRPVPSLSGYRTPVRGLFHSGAGNHPMGTLSGWSGRSAAREVQRAG